MKLFSTYNRINISASILIFLTGCMAFYFVLRFILIHELDQTLKTEKEEIIQYVKEHNQLPEVVKTSDQLIAYRQVKLPVSSTVYSSIKIWSNGNKETEWIRQLSFGITAAGNNYVVSVSKSQVEAEDMLQIILLIAAGMIALISVAGYVINRVVIIRLWKPFYSTINEVENYRLSKQQTLQLPEVAIEEFNLLNQSLNQMIDKIQSDYQVLKDFTGNAAHEMQTPLAVVRTHLEELSQDERVLRFHNRSIRNIEQSVSRLSRMNQSLLLLTKIENNQFPLNEEVQLDKIVQEKTEELCELIASRNILLQIQAVPVKIYFHHYLAEVVIANLMHNAIRYNRKEGKINVCLEPHRLVISNTSELPMLDKDKIFKRFYRHPETKAEGNGLGLSIVYQISEMALFQVTYEYSNNLHNFSIGF